MRRIFILLATLLTTAMTAALWADVRLSPDRKLAFAQQIIANYYVDTIDTTKVVEDAIVAMLKDLDPHSTYSNAEETRELTEPLDGNFSGIGIRFQMNNDTLYVIESVAGGPSERVGIQPGDRIISCNDTVIAGVKKSNSEILKVLRGPKGSIAHLKVLRKRTPEPIMFAVKRDEIPIYSVDASYMVNDSVGFISIARFAGTTADEVNEAMKKLSKSGMKHLIIDLCDNGGGYLKASTDVVNNFLRRGDLIVYTDSPKNGSSRFEAPTDGKFLDGRVVVMVNQYSASASEILSGALQDNDRGVIVGRRTFGKGLVQRPFPFPDGSMIRLTVARYHTPSGRCIQKPYADGDDDAYRMDMVNRYKSGELSSADSISLPDSLRYSTLRLGRAVYGGGGIMPDVFVPNDTVGISSYYINVLNAGLLQKFAFQYTDRRRETLSKAANLSELLRLLPSDDELLQQFVSYASSNGVPARWYYINISHRLIVNYLKALIASDTLGRETYYQVANTDDTTVQRALRELTEGRATAPITAGTDSLGVHPVRQGGK